MAFPSRFGGPKESEKRPGFALTVVAGKPKMPSRFGGPSEEGEDPGEPMDDGAAKIKAAEELLSAIERKSAQAVVSAFEALFLACEAEPHEEAPHEDSEGEGA